MTKAQGIEAAVMVAGSLMTASVAGRWLGDLLRALFGSLDGAF